MNIIKMKDVSKHFLVGNERVCVLDKIDFHVKEGEFVALLGPSGSGKSTLLNLIGGIDQFDTGRVVVAGQDYSKASDKQMSKFRRTKIGFVFQSFCLLPVMSCYDNITLPILINKGTVHEDAVQALMSELGIESKRDMLPTKLSGGERQRVAIARALINKPQVVLADEPTGNLDTATGKKVCELLIQGVRKQARSLVMVTHNEEIAKSADRVVRIKDGKVLTL